MLGGQGEWLGWDPRQNILKNGRFIIYLYCILVNIYIKKCAKVFPIYFLLSVAVYSKNASGRTARLQYS